MDHTLEELLAEKERRGAQQQPSFNQHTLEELLAEKEKRGISTNQPAMRWDKIQEGVQSGFKEALPDSLEDTWPAIKRAGEAVGSELYGLGKHAVTNPMRLGQNAGQGLWNAFESTANISPNIINYLKDAGFFKDALANYNYKGLPHLDVAKLVGREGQPEPGDALGTAFTEYLLPGKVSRIGASGAGLFRKILQTGASFGMHAIGKNENPVPSFIHGALGEAAFEGLANSPNIIKKGINTSKKIKDVVKKGAGYVGEEYNKTKNSLSAAQISEDLAIKETNAVNKKFSAKYNNFHADVAEAGIEKIPDYYGINKGAVEQVKEGIGEYSKQGKSFGEAFNKYTHNPTYENAAKAISEAKKVQREISSNIKRAAKRNESIPKIEQNALELARELDSQMSGNLNKSFESAGRPDFIDRLNEINKGYKNKVVPLKYNPDVQDYRRYKSLFESTKTGDLKAAQKQFVANTAKSRDFQSAVGGKYYQPARHELIKAWLKHSGIVGGGSVGTAIGLKYGLPKIMNYFSNEE